MQSRSLALGSLFACAILVGDSSFAQSSIPSNLSSSVTPPITAGSTFNLILSGQPGVVPIFVLSRDPGPTSTPFGILDVGIDSPPFPIIFGAAPIPPSGMLTVPCPTTCAPELFLIQEPFYLQALTFALGPIMFNDLSNRLVVDFAAADCGAPCVIPAVPDPSISSSAFTHSFCMTGLGCDFVFNPPGIYNEYADGTATLTGTIEKTGDPDKKFMVDVLFSGRESLATNSGVFPPAGSPKQSLDPSAYIDMGGPADPSEWRYFVTTNGTLTGMGDYDGAIVTFVRRGASFQVGFGANDKNLLFGASGWFDATTVQQPTTGIVLPSAFTGDINVELTETCP